MVTDTVSLSASVSLFSPSFHLLPESALFISLVEMRPSWSFTPSLDVHAGWVSGRKLLTGSLDAASAVVTVRTSSGPPSRLP